MPIWQARRRFLPPARPPPSALEQARPSPPVLPTGGPRRSHPLVIPTGGTNRGPEWRNPATHCRGAMPARVPRPALTAFCSSFPRTRESMLVCALPCHLTPATYHFFPLPPRPRVSYNQQRIWRPHNRPARNERQPVRAVGDFGWQGRNHLTRMALPASSF
jgi:hypothetical protein